VLAVVLVTPVPAPEKPPVVPVPLVFEAAPRFRLPSLSESTLGSAAFARREL
jgi:hypothetical protein